MDIAMTTELSNTTRLAAYYDHNSYAWDEVTGDGLGVYTLDIARGYSDIKGGPCSEDLDRLTRNLDRHLHERAIELYLYLSNRTYKRLSLRGYSQGEWADVIVYAADAGPDGEWLNGKNATADIESWFRGDLYRVTYETLEQYKNTKNETTIERWEISDSCNMVTLSNSYTLADAGRDIFGSDIFTEEKVITS